MTNALLGHLPIADECLQRFPLNSHPHHFAHYIKEKWNLPEVFYVDWRPAGPVWLFIADPELASQYVTTGQSLPKSRLETSFMDRFLGSNNMVSLEGPRWKSVRSMFNSGFASKNVMTLVPYIVDATLVFCDVMREKATSKENFELEEYATRLTMDVIGRVVLDTDLSAQRRTHPIVNVFRRRVSLMPPASALFPWQGIDLRRPFRLWWNGRMLDRLLGEELDRKIRQQAETDDRSNESKRSIIDMALRSFESETDKNGRINGRIVHPSMLPRSVRRDIIDSLKTFVFAGHDTTSSTICWTFYMLHLHPEVHAKVKAELDSIFPPGTSTADALKADPWLLNRMEYTTAVIRESMRVFPPASTLRQFHHPDLPPSSKTQTYMMNPKTGQRLPLDLPGIAIWPVVHLISRNPRFFPEATKFIPERFLPDQTPFPNAELFTPAGRDAFRPFEKGPRNCIGQELAMIELKVVLALMAREFDFTVRFPSDSDGEAQWTPTESIASDFNDEYAAQVKAGKLKKDRIEGHKLYQILSGTAKPAGGCPGTMRLR
jgi:cytochrome P450